MKQAIVKSRIEVEGKTYNSGEIVELQDRQFNHLFKAGAVEEVKKKPVFVAQAPSLTEPSLAILGTSSTFGAAAKHSFLGKVKPKGK